MKALSASPRRGDSPDTKESVAYAELLQMAHDEGLKSIQTQLLISPNGENEQRCIVKAVVETTKGRFEGIGDADPISVPDFLIPHTIRVAETRAKARALRDAVNCGIVALEELGKDSKPEGHQMPAVDAVGRPRSSPQRRSPRFTGGRSGSNASSDPDATMTEAQRRYLFRLLAGQGYQGKAAEDYLYQELEVRSLQHVTRNQASTLIDQLLKTSAPQGSGGNGADRSQR